MKSKFPNSKIKYKRLGNIIINDVLLINPNDTLKYVYKKYSNITSIIKWTLLSGLTFYGCKYFISYNHRIHNEIFGLLWSQEEGHTFGICAPKVKEQLKDGIILDFVQGSPIDDFTRFTPSQYITNFKNIGSMLFDVHNLNYSFGDCKAENIFYSAQENKYYFIDFEQFKKTENGDFSPKVWDLTELFFYLGHIFPTKKSHSFYKKVIFTFLNSYYDRVHQSDWSNNLKQQMLSELGKLRYTIIYATFMTPRTFLFVLRTIADWKKHQKTKWTKAHESPSTIHRHT